VDLDMRAALRQPIHSARQDAITDPQSMIGRTDLYRGHVDGYDYLVCDDLDVDIPWAVRMQVIEISKDGSHVMSVQADRIDNTVIEDGVMLAVSMIQVLKAGGTPDIARELNAALAADRAERRHASGARSGREQLAKARQQEHARLDRYLVDRFGMDTTQLLQGMTSARGLMRQAIRQRPMLADLEESAPSVEPERGVEGISGL
jgi:hypothetical protein